MWPPQRSNSHIKDENKSCSLRLCYRFIRTSSALWEIKKKKDKRAPVEESYRLSGSTQSLAWKLMKRLNSRHVGSFVLGNKHHIRKKKNPQQQEAQPLEVTHNVPMFVECIISKTPPNTKIVVLTLQEIWVALLWTPLVPGLSWTVCSWPPSWLQGQDPDLGHTVTHCDCLILLWTYNCTLTITQKRHLKTQYVIFDARGLSVKANKRLLRIVCVRLYYTNTPSL